MAGEKNFFEGRLGEWTLGVAMSTLLLLLLLLLVRRDVARVGAVEGADN
ncbi:MAG: hypothetical protein ACP5E5_01070 [Acidobacteriaceae bacterium]